ncbi:MAG: type II toxin-antitoxin system HicA family toxin [Nitrospirales bacterium]
MPRKIRELLHELERAGFVNRGGKGSHRNFKHPMGVRITLSGQLSEDAKPYQERAVKKALEEVKHETE